jgi:hypothetical protein
MASTVKTNAERCPCWRPSFGATAGGAASLGGVGAQPAAPAAAVRAAGKEGNPHELVTAKSRQHMIQTLLAWLPRLGLIFETCQLIETAREMERKHPVGPGAVTEFDELFKIGYKSLVRTIIYAASRAKIPSRTKSSSRSARTPSSIA